MNKQIEELARVIWNIRREDEDRCDMEIEDLGLDHSVWREAEAVFAELAKQSEPVAWVSPLRYGSQVTFYKPVEPEEMGDDAEWYCKPLTWLNPEDDPLAATPEPTKS